MKKTLELDDIQGLLTRGYGTLRAATFVLLRIDNRAAARAWVGTLAGEVATGRPEYQADAVHVAFTCSGLRKLGVPEDTLDRFPVAFIEGMTTDHRRRMFGDVAESSPDRWQWGGPASPVDALLLLYAEQQDALAAFAERHAGPAALRAAGLTEVARLDTSPLEAVEPFGFRDGISQPEIAELARSGRPASRLHTVHAGEFVLGYPNQYGQLTESPTVAADDDPGRVLPRSSDPKRGDLGRNGSYLVMRQLGQDVDGFRRFVDQAARENGRAARENGGAARENGRAEAGDRLAAKMVGRWPNGAPLTLAPDQPPDSLAGDPEANEFGYATSDAAGLGCPIGAHIRRANPRDAVDPDASPEESITFVNRHRLLRRGRAYGDPSGTEGRGLHFICLNANLARQFEFVQHTWLNNPKFGGLYDDSDPLVATRPGDGGRTFTVPGRPIRQRIAGLPGFVTVRGGAYFFLPGRTALRFLAEPLAETYREPSRRMS